MRKGKPVVLLVDDDASVRKSLRRLFRSAGYTVQIFASGMELFSYDPFEGPCCLVLDVQMPVMSGLDVQQRLASSGRSSCWVAQGRATSHGTAPGRCPLWKLAFG